MTGTFRLTPQAPDYSGYVIKNTRGDNKNIICIVTLNNVNAILQGV